MSDLDDLVQAMVKGDPDETVPTPILMKMAQWAIWEHWIPCPHADWITERSITDIVGRRTCQRCGGRLVVEGGYVVTEPEATDG